MFALAASLLLVAQVYSYERGEEKVTLNPPGQVLHVPHYILHHPDTQKLLREFEDAINEYMDAIVRTINDALKWDEDDNSVYAYSVQTTLLQILMAITPGFAVYHPSHEYEPASPTPEYLKRKAFELKYESDLYAVRDAANKMYRLYQRVYRALTRNGGDKNSKIYSVYKFHDSLEDAITHQQLRPGGPAVLPAVPTFTGNYGEHTSKDQVQYRPRHHHQRG